VVQIIERKEDAGSDRPFQLQVYPSPVGKPEVYAHAGSHGLIIRFGTPPQEALNIAIEFCEQREIGHLWVDDPRGLFPPNARRYAS
jgi:hypothetical protein